MENHSQPFDVCIVCALPEEVRAFLAVVEPHCDDHLEGHISPRYKYSYHSGVLKNNKGKLLTLHISWLPRYGPQEMILHLSHVLEEYHPRIAIMTGICAGDAQQVHLGDLVVAERTFTYDNGKFVSDEQGPRVHLYDTLTYQLDENILQFLGLFDDWKPLVAGLETSPQMSDQHNTVCHIKAMASGSAVRADNPFQDVRAPVRGTVAIDMEGAAFGLVMSRHPLTRWLIVKGVCDFADRAKNDAYHDYAARASALYALSFIQAYVTNERLPSPPGTSLSDNLPMRLVSPIIPARISPERVAKIWTHQELDYVDNVTFHPGSQWLVTIVRGSNILTFWDVAVGEIGRTLTISYGMRDIAFSPNGLLLASCNYGGETIEIRNMATGELVRTLKHSSGVMQVEFSPDGLWLASASLSEQYYIWGVATGKLQQRVGGYHNMDIPGFPLAFSPDGQWLAGLDRYGSQLTIWQVGNGDVVQTFKDLAYGGINNLAFSPDGQWLACASTNETFCCAQLWSVATGKIVRTFDAQTIRGKQTIRDYAGPLKFSPGGQPYDKLSIRSLAFSPDGQWLAIGGATTLALWDIAARKFRRTFEAEAYHLAFSPDGQWLATDGSKTITLWKMQ